MTPQLTSPQPLPPAHPDACINHVLEALRTAAPPAGLEQRIAARLAQAAEARQASAPQPRPLITTDIAAEPSIFTTILNAARSPKSLFTVISTGARSAQWRDPRIPLTPARLYAAATALTLLVTLTTITLLHHHTPTTIAQSKPVPSASTQSVNLAQTSAAANTHVPQAFSLRSPSPAKVAAVLTPAPTEQPNLDTIALAETRAPSRPAPPMPLTPQEHLLLAAARPGQPIEVAELDMARAPNLRATAEYREDASLRRYVKTLLAPFAVADALSPTTTSQPQEISTTAPAPQPSASLTN
jgi:hypothetical protein